MAILTVNPNPATVSTVVSVAGSGFSNLKTRLLLDGAGASSNIFRPTKGFFNVGITVGSTAKTQVLVAQQLNGSTWSDVAKTSIVVQAASTPPPPPPPSSSGPITVTTDNVIIQDKQITLALGPNGAGIIAKNVSNLTIKNCHIVGGNVGASFENVTNLVMEDVVIEDSDYAGILAMSGITGRLTRVTVRRVGFTKDPNTSSAGNNAYGMAISNYDNGSPQSRDWLIEDCLIEDVPLWHGFDTHAGVNITLKNTTIRRTPRPIFITSFGVENNRRATNVNLDHNNLLEPVTKTGGTSLAAITLVRLNGGLIDYNLVDKGYGTPIIYEYYDPAYPVHAVWTDGGHNTTTISI